MKRLLDFLPVSRRSYDNKVAAWRQALYEADELLTEIKKLERECTCLRDENKRLLELVGIDEEITK